MGRAVTLFALFFLLSNGVYGQQPTKIKGLREQYRKGETIGFSIENNDNKKVFIHSVSMLVFDDGRKEWFEQVYDMLNPNCNPVAGHMGFILKGNASEMINWNPRKTNPHKCFNYKTNKGTYKICYKYSFDEQIQAIEICSSAFKIK